MTQSKYTFFWQQQSPFSQWHLVNFEVNGLVYNCCEQYMMHQKALLFGDEKTAEKVMHEKEPYMQKQLGREVKPFNEKTWNEHAKRIVYQGNEAKFTQNPKLLKKLMETKGTLLVEASPYDKIWGVGLSATDPKINDPKNWRGTNWLGEVLTNLREDLEKAVK